MATGSCSTVHELSEGSDSSKCVIASEAKQSPASERGDCFVTSFLAMTIVDVPSGCWRRMLEIRLHRATNNNDLSNR